LLSFVVREEEFVVVVVFSGFEDILTVEVFIRIIRSAFSADALCDHFVLAVYCSKIDGLVRLLLPLLLLLLLLPPLEGKRAEDNGEDDDGVESISIGFLEGDGRLIRGVSQDSIFCVLCRNTLVLSISYATVRSILSKLGGSKDDGGGSEGEGCWLPRIRRETMVGVDDTEAVRIGVALA